MSHCRDRRLVRGVPTPGVTSRAAPRPLAESTISYSSSQQPDALARVETTSDPAGPATSEARPPYTDPLPAPEVAAPDDTPRPTIPPRHMVDDAEPAGDNPEDLGK